MNLTLETRKVVHLKQNTEMGHWYVMVIDRVRGGNTSTGMKVRHELMASKVPVDPRVRLASTGAPQHLTVELGGSIQVVDRDRQMETGPTRGDHSVTLLPASRQ